MAEFGILFLGLHYGGILIYLEGLPLGENFDANVGRAVFLAAGLYQKDERA
jgi:hypothetical protein